MWIVFCKKENNEFVWYTYVNIEH